MQGFPAFDGPATLVDTKSMHLDTGTVIVVASVIGGVVTVFAWSLAWARAAPRWRRSWAWGSLALTVGVLFFLSQPLLGVWGSVIVANGLTILGYYLFERSLRLFAGRPGWKYQYLTVALLYLVPFLLFTFVWNLFLVRVVASAVLVIGAWISIIAVTLTLPERRRHPGLTNTLIAFALVPVALTALRALAALLDRATTLLSSGDALVLLFVGGLVAIVAWTLGLVTLEVLRTQDNLESALATRDRMMKTIAHDLRGPLGGQAGLLELMQNQGYCRDDGEEMLDLLALASQENYDLLENLLAWAQSQQGKPELQLEDLDGRELLLQATGPYAAAVRSKGLRLDLDAAPGTVHADRASVTTILRNLVSNAVKFSKAGGSVAVTFRRVDGRAEFQVEDTGPGIPEDQLAKLNAGGAIPSRPGSQREQGSGIGLTLCREYAELNGGQLTFRSSPAGTIARLLLP